MAGGGLSDPFVKLCSVSDGEKRRDGSSDQNNEWVRAKFAIVETQETVMKKEGCVWVYV